MNLREFLNSTLTQQLAQIWQSITGSPANGKTALGEVVPLLVDNDGRLATDLTFSGTVSIGTVAIDQSAPNANEVVVKTSALPAGAATEATAASILTKLADPATSAKQDTAKGVLDSILAKITASAATAANQTTANASLSSIDGKVATQTTLASILARITAAVGTETTLAAILAKLTNVDTSAVTISSGSVTVSDETVGVAHSSALESYRQVKASSGTLFTLSGYNSGPSQWIQLHNVAATPANGVAPVLTLAVPAQSSFMFEWAKGIPCGNGIFVCNSYDANGPTAAATKVIGSNDCYFTATFK